MEFDKLKRYFCCMISCLFRYIILLLLILSYANGITQSGNPFDMEHKVSSGVNWKAETELILPSADEKVDSTEIVAESEPIDPAFDADLISGNPFDIGKSSSVVNEIKPPPAPAPKKKIALTDQAKASISKFKISISILLMLALALISTLLRHVILKVIEGFRSDNLLRTYFRNIGRKVTLPIFLLELFFVVNAAFACFLFFDKSNLLQNQPIVEFLKILLGMSIIVFGKHVALFIIREVFPIRKEVAEYNFTFTVFLAILGLTMMPCNLILGFAPDPMATISLYFIGIVTVLVLGYLCFRALLIGSKFLSTNRFHFFMYLCTVEIAPLFILFKVVKNYLGS